MIRTGLSRPDREGGADPCGPRRGSLASVRSDHAALRGVCVVGVGRHDLSRPEGLGFLACERPPEGLQAGRRGDYGVRKKARRTRGGNPRDTRARHTHRGVVPDELRVGPRTSSPIAGPQRARVPAPSTTNARNRPMCSVRSAPNSEPVRLSCCRPATLKPCSFISTRSLQRSRWALTPF